MSSPTPSWCYAWWCTKPVLAGSVLCSRCDGMLTPEVRQLMRAAIQAAVHCAAAQQMVTVIQGLPEPQREEIRRRARREGGGG